MANNNNKEKIDKNKENVKKEEKSPLHLIPPKLIGALADEVAKTLMSRLPGMVQSPTKRIKNRSKNKKLDSPVFLDTSAIIDGRIFDVINLGLMDGSVVIPESILLELKHIADSQDTVKRERGRKGLEMLDSLKKAKKVKVVYISGEEEKRLIGEKNREVDEKLIAVARVHKGKIITCDFNLEKKSNIQGVLAINVNALANCLKVRAVPGEALHIKILHQGKDSTQGVGYLDDGTMIVVENGSSEVGNTADVVVSRVIQTTAGRILFAKKI